MFEHVVYDWTNYESLTSFFDFRNELPNFQSGALDSSVTSGQGPSGGLLQRTHHFPVSPNLPYPSPNMPFMQMKTLQYKVMVA